MYADYLGNIDKITWKWKLLGPHFITTSGHTVPMYPRNVDNLFIFLRKLYFEAVIYGPFIKTVCHDEHHRQ